MPPRTIDVVLDDSLDVGVAGFACEDDQLVVDEQVATGTDVATLFAQLDGAYDTTVGEALRGGVDPVQLADDLAANPTAGFFDPGCPSYQSIAWKPSRADGDRPEPLPARRSLGPRAVPVGRRGVDHPHGTRRRRARRLHRVPVRRLPQLTITGRATNGCVWAPALAD